MSVTITDEPLTLEDLLAVVDGAHVELADSARSGIAASRAIVDGALARNDAVYGLTTQVGHGKDTLRWQSGSMGSRGADRVPHLLSPTYWRRC
jgi:histidine ammonia-lyase